MGHFKEVAPVRNRRAYTIMAIQSLYDGLVVLGRFVKRWSTDGGSRAIGQRAIGQVEGLVNGRLVKRTLRQDDCW